MAIVKSTVYLLWEVTYSSKRVVAVFSTCRAANEYAQINFVPGWHITEELVRD